jgi:hypothetical protein
MVATLVALELLVACKFAMLATWRVEEEWRCRDWRRRACGSTQKEERVLLLRENRDRNSKNSKQIELLLLLLNLKLNFVVSLASRTNAEAFGSWLREKNVIIFYHDHRLCVHRLPFDGKNMLLKLHFSVHTPPNFLFLDLLRW